MPAAFAGRAFAFARCLAGTVVRCGFLASALALLRSGRGFPAPFLACAAGRGFAAPFAGRPSRSDFPLVGVGRAAVRVPFVLLRWVFLGAGFAAGLAGRVATLGLVFALRFIEALAAPAARVRAGPGLVGRAATVLGERPAVDLTGRLAAGLSGRAEGFEWLRLAAAGRTTVFAVVRPEGAFALLRSRSRYRVPRVFSFFFSFRKCPSV